MASIEERLSKLEKTLRRIGIIVAATTLFMAGFLGYTSVYQISEVVTRKINELAVVKALADHEKKASDSAKQAKGAAERATKHEAQLSNLVTQGEKELTAYWKSATERVTKHESQLSKLLTQSERKLVELEDAITGVPRKAKEMLNGAQLKCSWELVGYDKSQHPYWGEWCPKKQFITQLDLDRNEETKEVYVHRALCCKMSFP